ncbi:MAG: hypothetical protein KBD48_00305 [Candidatus Pacebacteria bacterium]|nr:hypothetical protein [Candidatus Paceibacterota bacterium]
MANSKQKQAPTRVITLCGSQGCCPTVSFFKKGIVIKDDFGGSVKLTRKQFMAMLKTR